MGSSDAQSYTHLRARAHVFTFLRTRVRACTICCRLCDDCCAGGKPAHEALHAFLTKAMRLRELHDRLDAAVKASGVADVVLYAPPSVEPDFTSSLTQTAPAVPFSSLTGSGIASSTSATSSHPSLDSVLREYASDVAAFRSHSTSNALDVTVAASFITAVAAPTSTSSTTSSGAMAISAAAASSVSEVDSSHLIAPSSAPVPDKQELSERDDAARMSGNNM